MNQKVNPNAMIYGNGSRNAPVAPVGATVRGNVKTNFRGESDCKNYMNQMTQNALNQTNYRNVANRR